MEEKYIVDEIKRLDMYLSKILGISRNQAQHMAESNVFINGEKPKKTGMKVREGDVVTIDRTIKRKSTIVPKDIAFGIVYEDDDIIVVNKPRGLVVHPAVGHPDDTLANALAYRYNISQEMASDENRMGIVHRIDKDTSGLLLVAKTPEAKENLSEQIFNHDVDREYLCLAFGYFRAEKFRVKGPIARNEYNRKKMCVDVDRGKPAVTHFTVARQFKSTGLLMCKLETGRTHQIRVHLQLIKHSILGDMIYGTHKLDVANKGQVLHAYRIAFKHPRTGKDMVFFAPIDKYFKNCLKYVANID